MSEPYIAYLFFPEGRQKETAVHATHELITSHYGELDNDSLLILDSAGEEDAETYCGLNPDEILQKLTAWSASGSVSYFICNVSISIAFYTVNEKVYAIQISALPLSFIDNPVYKKACIDLVKVLDEEFAPARTIMQWGLTSANGYDWQEELDRLRRKEVIGTYEILDIRRI